MSIDRTSSWPQAAAGFLYCSKTKRVMLHQRDAHTLINPNTWAFFTGLVESGESPLYACLREIQEEIGYRVATQHIRQIDTYPNESQHTIRHVFVVTVESEFLPQMVYEGAGVDWFTFNEVNELDATRFTKEDLQRFSRCVPAQDQ